MKQLVYIFKMATSPEGAKLLAQEEYERFIRSIAGKPIAIENIERSTWEETVAELIDPTKERIRHHARIIMRVSGEPDALEELKQQLQEASTPER